MELSDVKDEQSLIAFGNEFFERSAKAKRRYEQQWLLNLAFIAGDQLIKVNRHTGRLEEVNTEYDPEWMVRTVNNRILPAYRTMIAKLTKNTPRPSACAHSKEESDIQAARAAVKLEECHWRTLGLDQKHIEMASWLAATGNCFYKQFWNDKKGDRVIDLTNMDFEAGLTPQGLPRLKPEAAGHIKPIEFTLGDTDLLVRSPFNIYPQPGKTKLRDMRIIGDAELMDVDEVEETYKKKVSPEVDTSLVRVHQNIEGIIAVSGYSQEKPDNVTTVKEMYILPCRQFPKGAKVVWTQDTLLHIEEECYDLPFVHFGLIEMPGKFWYKGIVDDLIPLQRRWNALLSKIEMHNDFYNDPPIIVDPNYIDIDNWTSEPGQIFEAKKPMMAGQHPWVMPVPALDQAILRELDILDKQFEVVPVLHKVSYGEGTPHAKSGIAINFLQEKDDDIIRPLIENIETGYADVFKRDFKLCQENYEEDRGFAIVGEDNETEWIEFKRANLDANIDVGVEPGSAMPRSKVAQQAMVLDMLQAGFFTDPRTGMPDFAKALKYMEFGSVNDIYEEAALDANQAKRENEDMKEGVPALAEYWHNHDVHIYEHNRYRKTADFETQPDEIRMLFAAHIAQHEEFAQPAAALASASSSDVRSQAGQDTVTPSQQIAADPAQQIAAMLEDMQVASPDQYARLMALPEEQRTQAIVEMMVQMQQGQGRPTF